MEGRRTARGLILVGAITVALTCLCLLFYYALVFAASGTEIVEAGTLSYYLRIDADMRNMPVFAPAASPPRYLYSSGDVGPTSTTLMYCARAKEADVDLFYRTHFSARKYSSAKAESNTVYFSRGKDRFALELASEPDCAVLVRVHHFLGG